MNERSLMSLVVAGALFVACQSLPEWPADLGKATSTGAAGGGAGTTGAAGATSNPGTAGAAAGTSGAAGTPAGGAGGATAGTSGAAGAGGAGGAPATGGMSGAMAGEGGGGMTADPLAEGKLALANLDGFVYTESCKFGNNGTDVTTLNGCQAADICWQTADLGRFAETKTIKIAGVAGHAYRFDVHLRGVIEPRDYPAAPNCTRLPNMPTDTVGASECADGFANKNSVTFNVFELAIPTPAHKYYLNSVPVHPPHRVDRADWKWTVTVAANQTLTFTMDDLNGGQIRNCNGVVLSSDIKVAMQPFNGQWFQLNVDWTTLQVM